MNSFDAPPESELSAAKAWFPKTDRVAGRDDITAFKQKARLRQTRWRKARGYPIGHHVRRDGTKVENGSKTAPAGPITEDFRNFLDNDRIRAAVRRRTDPASRERGQQIRPDRLRYDLLSSMPMCFNLFGQLHDDAERLGAAGAALFDVPRPGHAVMFEHSPGRQSMDYTNDGTAFDVALSFGAPGEPRVIIGIETKYHEHAFAEPKPDTLTKKRPVIPESRLKMPRYREIATRAQSDGIFRPGWEELLGTELQQIWRDHLLLLAMLQHNGGATYGAGKYVLVHPERNPSFAEAGERYRRDFLDDARTFEVMTVEELLRPSVLHEQVVEADFRHRYLW